MSTDTATHFTFEVLSPAPIHFRVVRFAGREAVNEPFRFDILATDGLAGRRPSLIGHPCCLRFSPEGAVVRSIHGIVAAVGVADTDVAGRHLLRFRLEPRLGRLRHRRASRIFQDMTAQEIVSTYLERERIPSRWVLGAPLVKRPYCVQYDETDYGFIRRICAAEGIFFFLEDPKAEFELPAGLHPDARVVFANCIDAYPITLGDAEFIHRPMAAPGSALTELENALTVFERRERQRPRRVLLRRYVFERPQFPPFEWASEEPEHPNPHTRSEMADFVDEDLTIYEHQQSRESTAATPVAARIALETERTRAVEVAGRTFSRRLSPGHRFTLAEHAVPDLDGAYVVASIRHAGSSKLSSTRCLFRVRGTRHVDRVATTPPSASSLAASPTPAT